jgi:DHA1 family bicyclomycin/chloramphenicol resistance-like MFS transporter
MPRTGISGRIPPATAHILAVLTGLAALAPLSVDIYTPSLPEMQREFASPEWLVQASITACLLGIGIGQLLWGPLSDRVGRRPVILVGVIGWTIASILSALAETAPMLILVRALAGVCGAAGIVVARSVVRDLSSDLHVVSSRIGLLALVTGIAPVIAPVAGAAMAAVWGWRADFVALAALGGIIILAMALLVPETLPPDQRTTGGGLAIAASLGSAIRDRELAGVSLAVAAHAFGFYAYITTTPFIIERQLGYPPAAFALVFGVNATAMLCANIVFRRIVRTRHPSFPLGIGLATSTLSGAALLVAALTGAPEWTLWVASTSFAASAGFVLPGSHSWGQATLVLSGSASALTGASQFLGGVIGSPVTGVIGPTATNLGLVILISSVCGLGAWVYARRHLTGRGAPIR